MFDCSLSLSLVQIAMNPAFEFDFLFSCSFFSLHFSQALGLGWSALLCWMACLACCISVGLAQLAALCLDRRLWPARTESLSTSSAFQARQNRVTFGYYNLQNKVKMAFLKKNTTLEDSICSNILVVQREIFQMLAGKWPVLFETSELLGPSLSNYYSWPFWTQQLIRIKYWGRPETLAHHISHFDLLSFDEFFGCQLSDFFTHYVGRRYIITRPKIVH